ncbi:MAG TPA: YfhO family protein [Thermoanaerobaculia bacterium]|nr:YfhO family protein [Thermoanaerobaculia bacterium]
MSEGPEEPRPAASVGRRDDALALGSLLALVCALFADVLFFGKNLYIRDLFLFHFPGKATVRRILLSGELPTWNPELFGGQPLAANPNSEVFYPLQLPILLPDYLLGFQLHIVLHFLILAAGAWALARFFGAGRRAAILGGMSLALGGLALSASNVLPTFFSLAWMPWVLLWAGRALESRRARDAAAAAIFFGMQSLVGEPTVMLQTAALVALLAFRHAARERGMWRARLAPLAIGAAIGVAGTAMAAVQMIPAIELTRDSVRAEGFEPADAAVWSMPPIRPLELLVPHAFGSTAVATPRYWSVERFYHEQQGPFFFSIYPGLAVALLALAMLAAHPVRGLPIAGVFALSWLVAIGIHGPLFAPLHRAGVFQAVRYPEKFILTAVLIVSIGGAVGLQRLASGEPRMRRAFIAAALAFAGAALAALAVSRTEGYASWFLGTWGIEPGGERAAAMLETSRAGVLGLAGRAAGVLLVAVAVLRRSARWTVALAIAVLALDLASLNRDLAPRADASLFSPPPIAEALPEPRSAYRIFHLAEWVSRSEGEEWRNLRGTYWIYRNGMFPRLPQAWGFHTALDADFDETYLAPTAALMSTMQEAADRGIPGWRDAMMEMTASSFWTRFRPRDAELARVEGAVQLARPVQIVGSRFVPRYRFPERLIAGSSREAVIEAIEQRRWRAGTSFIDGEPFDPAPARVLAVDESANRVRIEVEADGRALLVASVTADDQWIATLDGEPVPIRRADLAYQGIEVPAGKHLVELRYSSRILLVSGAISISVLALLIAIACGARLHRARRD